jgi:glyoxylase-like metal-dependent hydrolase (beta-lactamase superfamily II)/8-oxo-dGTP pyrophosphatase MutT (NUDIX family)
MTDPAGGPSGAAEVAPGPSPAGPGVRLAASLVLLRQPPSGAMEVLMMLRPDRGADDQRSNAAVFPGGVLDARDRAAHACCLGADDAVLSRRLGLAEGGLDYAVAALRETFEEVGLLLACCPDGSPPTPGQQAQARAWRLPLHRGEAGMAELCAALDLRLDLRGLVYSGHWLTPPGTPKRFDTRFFTVAAPADQQAEPDGSEATAALWLAPQQALAPAQGLKLLPVTRRTLAELGGFASPAQALAHYAARESVPLVMPRRCLTARGPGVVLPQDLAYAEVGRLDPDGRGDVRAEIVAGLPVRLSDAVWRLTAPNPGPMTGPGTNSYLVGGAPAPGEPAQWTVIDPGPDDPGHVQALQQAAAAAGGRIVRILATHTHRDHSPAAAALAAATGAEVLGRSPAHPEWQDAGFAPARQLQHGERLVLAPGVVLRVIHTPGHAGNHLCYLLEAERLLFTGDHVMQGSTVVINPPDGDMAAYLTSLQDLLREDLQWLAPGHGFLVDRPHDVLRALIAHRLRREAKVAAALAAAGQGTAAELLPRVYDDVPPALHPMALRSLRAHLLKLHAEGRADCGVPGLPGAPGDPSDPATVWCAVAPGG